MQYCGPLPLPIGRRQLHLTNLFSIMQEQPKFKSGVWEAELNVRDFVSQNVTPYDGDASFLSGPTE